MKYHNRLFTLLLIIISSPLYSISQPSLEKKVNYFYKDVLNEYVFHSTSGGRVIIKTNNGELVLKDNKKYIKPSSLGEIIITIEEITTDSKIKTEQHYKCIPLPDASLYYLTMNNDTLPVYDTISKINFRNIKSIIPKISDENVSSPCALMSYKIEIFLKKGYLYQLIESKNTFSSLPKVSAGDKIIIKEVFINVEGMAEYMQLRNRLIEITE